MYLNTATHQGDLLDELAGSEYIDQGVDCTVEVDKHLRDGSVVEPEWGGNFLVHFEENKGVPWHITDGERQNNNEGGPGSSDQGAGIAEFLSSTSLGQSVKLDDVGNGGKGEDGVGYDEGRDEQKVNVFHQHRMVYDVPHAVDEDWTVDIAGPIEVGNDCDQYTEQP